ncbi:MAG: hypothetical protein ACXAES_03165 [Promethearchaeota archaeon]|jgi:DNA-binding PadR family transcriptional regulator
MELKNVYPEKIPKKILEKNYVDDIILYALNAFGPLQKGEFNQINKTTFYKYLNRLMEKNFITSYRQGKTAFYEITPLGQAEFQKKLEIYKLDFKTLIELEKKRITSQISELNQFFNMYKITDEIIKIDFLYLKNELTFDESLSIYSEEQFNKLLLLIVMNHPKFLKNPKKTITVDKFLDKYNTHPKDKLSKTDVDMFIQEVIRKNRFGKKIYEVKFDDKINLYFRANSKLGRYFETSIVFHLRDFNHSKNLIGSSIYNEDLDKIIKSILNDLIREHNFFDPELGESLYSLIENFILDLQRGQFESPLIGISKISGVWFIL